MQLRRIDRRTPILGHTLDFRSTGMFVHAETGCEVGSTVMCTVAVPDGRRRLSGRVVRVEPLSAMGVGLGIEFDAAPEPARPLEAGAATPVPSAPAPPPSDGRPPRARRSRRVASLIRSAAALVGGAVASCLLVTWIMGDSFQSRRAAEAISSVVRPLAPPARAPAPMPASLPAVSIAAALPPTAAPPARTDEPSKIRRTVQGSNSARTRSAVRPRIALKVLPPGTKGPTITREGRLVGAIVPIDGSKAEMSHYSLAHPSGLAINFPHATSLLPLGIHVVRRHGFRTVSILERPEGGIQIRFSFMRGPPEVQTLEVDGAAVMLKAVFPGDK